MRKYRCLALKPNGYDSEPHWSLGNGDTAGDLFSAWTGLGFTGFLFALFQPVLRMSCQPTIGQRGFHGSRVAGSDGCNPMQYVGQVGPHGHAVPPGARAYAPPLRFTRSLLTSRWSSTYAPSRTAALCNRPGEFRGVLGGGKRCLTAHTDSGWAAVKRESHVRTRRGQERLSTPAVRAELFNLRGGAKVDPKSDSTGQTIRMEDFQLSPQGFWYPAVIRDRQFRQSEVHYHFDFDPVLPDSLFTVDSALKSQGETRITTPKGS